MLAEGMPARDDRAGLLAGRLPGARAAAERRAEHEADAPDPQRPRRRRGRGRRWVEHPADARHRPHARRVRAPRQARGRGLLRVRRRQAHAAVAGPARGFPPVDDPCAITLEDLQERMLFIEAIETRQVPRRGRDRVRRRREHRLDHGHRLPGLVAAASCSTSTATTAARRASSPARASSRRPTASASRRPSRLSPRPMRARPTRTRRRRSPPCSAFVAAAPEGGGHAGSTYGCVVDSVKVSVLL